MSKDYLFRGLLWPVMALLILSGIALGADQVSVMPDQSAENQALEEQGMELEPLIDNSGNNGTVPTLDSIPPDGVLLIPESTNDMVGMYDPFDGTFLGNLISGGGMFSTPINAIQGPDGNIYVSDQLADAIFVFDTTGTYLLTYADASDGLDNIRGIDFRNDTLFVTTIDTYVARFVGPHNRIADFFSGAGAFDIHFLDDGRSLLSSHASPNGVRLYDVDGTYISQIFDVSFPEQTIFDDLLPGAYLNGGFTADMITDFDLDGTIHQTTPLNLCRGAYRLGNGNILATNGSGVFELDPGSGNIIEQENTGQARVPNCRENYPWRKTSPTRSTPGPASTLLCSSSPTSRSRFTTFSVRRPLR
jgi:outer membrane protein assembly factor BamB